MSVQGACAMRPGATMRAGKSSGPTAASRRDLTPRRSALFAPLARAGAGGSNRCDDKKSSSSSASRKVVARFGGDSRSRASRLVVDTGVHHKGWSREEAVRFLVENTPLAKNNIANEVDRYITWPGQAVAYKTGQIEITRMRREAEASRGEAFDLSAFHDRVLGAGALPLPLLEERLAADW